MTGDMVKFFALQRQIFGICPHSGELFRLSDCKVYLKAKPSRDWMDGLGDEAKRLDAVEERLDSREESLREAAREKGRRLAMRTVRKIDPVFKPRKLNPDDAKVIFHPVDYVVFNGMKQAACIRNIVILDRKVCGADRLRLQRSIERVVEKGRYEWLTLRVSENGTIHEE